MFIRGVFFYLVSFLVLSVCSGTFYSPCVRSINYCTHSRETLINPYLLFHRMFHRNPYIPKVFDVLWMRENKKWEEKAISANYSLNTVQKTLKLAIVQIEPCNRAQKLHWKRNMREKAESGGGQGEHRQNPWKWLWKWKAYPQCWEVFAISISQSSIAVAQLVCFISS